MTSSEFTMSDVSEDPDVSWSRRIILRDQWYHQSSGELKIDQVGSQNTLRDIFVLYRDDWFHRTLTQRTHILFIGLIFIYTAYLLVFAGLYSLFNDPFNETCALDIVDTSETGKHPFQMAFAFALETAATSGFGLPDSHEGAFWRGCFQLPTIIWWQCFFGVLLNALCISLVVMRVGRADTRSHQVIFSDKACIIHRNGKFFFSFQCYDLDMHAPIVEAHVRCYVVMNESDGNTTANFQTRHMRLINPDDELGANLFLSVPCTVVHEIDQWSPLLPPTLRREHWQTHDDGFVHNQANRYRYPNVNLREADAAVAGRNGAQCPVCGTTFYTDEHLLRHIRYQQYLEGAYYSESDDDNDEEDNDDDDDDDDGDAKNGEEDDDAKKEDAFASPADGNRAPRAKRSLPPPPSVALSVLDAVDPESASRTLVSPSTSSFTSSRSGHSSKDPAGSQNTVEDDDYHPNDEDDNDEDDDHYDDISSEADDAKDPSAPLPILRPRLRSEHTEPASDAVESEQQSKDGDDATTETSSSHKVNFFESDPDQIEKTRSLPARPQNSVEDPPARPSGQDSIRSLHSLFASDRAREDSRQSSQSQRRSTSHYHSSSRPSSMHQRMEKAYQDQVRRGTSRRIHHHKTVKLSQVRGTTDERLKELSNINKPSGHAGLDVEALISRDRVVRESGENERREVEANVRESSASGPRVRQASSLHPMEKHVKDVKQSIQNFIEASELEIIVIVEGIEAQSSATFQARHSYTMDDIMYNHWFRECFGPDEKKPEKIVINFNHFHEVVPLDASAPIPAQSVL
ncbi:Inward rectifier potassium channel 2 [Hondaea fermentalgiana]|uniref:Inward rectifier potassium channel 2 n=1 Tax=Hondaea fermentalgiana TaxID=2315210 RepID=A0A2R5GPX4_9STRA|nr:Inward rectifier potassium channel 2 [Hondaea fermentalgiana]|eukprot:GBG31828.1 Inward rectifier potassium channel 2 [Hondaea fermentalgiana]